MPSRRAIALAALATLALALAVLAPGLLWVAGALDALVILGVVVDVRRARIAAVHAQREWPPLLVQGARSTVCVDLKARPGTILLLREALHPSLAELPLRHELAIASSGRAEWSYDLVPKRRGEHLVGPLTIRVAGPWGLGWSQRDLIAAEPRRVYPQTRWEGRVGRLLARADRRELGQAPLHARLVGGDPYALREYRPGDPPTRIQWKASARHGRLVVREDTWERGSRLVILLDCARSMASTSDGRSKLDHGLAAALALARIAVARGDRVTIVGFSDRIERVVRVRSGGRGIAQAYGALFDLDAHLREPAYDLAVETAGQIESRSATVLMLTSVLDIAAADLLQASLTGLRRKHRGVLVTLEDPALMALALGSPADAAEAFAKVASLGILLANRHLARRFRGSGIAVVTASADQLAWKTLETYLNLARRRRAPALAQVLAV